MRKNQGSVTISSKFKSKKIKKLVTKKELKMVGKRTSPTARKSPVELAYNEHCGLGGAAHKFVHLGELIYN